MKRLYEVGLRIRLLELELAMTKAGVPDEVIKYALAEYIKAAAPEEEDHGK